ncbi:hypothetical protein Nepgr_022910 [Nepenthes gracilis]|uniref:Uncharacterized protein n=1 Tax=Nepenthes gracilis TaxID=150966 RepID=A0AAD3T146_NEPGR|nr:hypothetical protein Nepgr_022910 [Nepenthes gracilis]
MQHQIECMLNLVSSYSQWWDLVLYWRFAVLLLRDDANRLNAGSFLFEAMVLFWLAEGKQLSFVGDSAYCQPVAAAFGCCPAAGSVGIGPVQQIAFFCAELAGVGGDVILMMTVFGSGVPELDILDVNACYPGPLGDLAARRLADMISCWFIAAPAVLGSVGQCCCFL